VLSLKEKKQPKHIIDFFLPVSVMMDSLNIILYHFSLLLVLC